ncbi:hypothetical protein MNB_SM-4-82 [hydrothermal vent metagenome]|uniref:DUF302 domain-containing protein n=1 Tax=hydrothermal vent metagenome TaxID=652676 RepID=A0A1W1CBP5_9ZZZZ
MTNKIIKLLFTLFVPLSLFGASGVEFFVVNGSAEKVFNTYINNDIENIGFILSDPHERVNDAYAQKYPPTDLENLGFFSISNDEALRPLLLKEPSLGGFNPFNLHIYKVKSEDKTYIGHVTPTTMLDITNVKDVAVREAFVEMFNPLDKQIQSTFETTKQVMTYKNLPAKTMMEFTYTFDRPDDISAFVETFQEDFEATMEKSHYLIAGYKDFKETYEDLELPFEKYDAYFVYSLCHMNFSYSIFKDRPDAGVFAPCSMYMYIEKDTNVMHIGMPYLANWAAVMNITDPKKLKAVKELDTEIVSVLESMNAKLVK